jgi:uncharacterized glyoxalase superfamily protein PhnB
MTLVSNTRATVIPCLRYRDAHTAIEWLCRVFGLEKHAVHETPDNKVAHAQLSFGNGMIMLGSIDNGSEYGKHIAQPDDFGNRSTQSIYVVTTDPDEICRRAKAGGAKVVMDIRDEDYGGRGFTCTDLEGHLWSFGSYDPWK